MGIGCGNAFQGLPESCLSGNGILMPAGLWFTQSSEQFDTKILAGDDANWITKIVAGSLTVIHDIEETENVTGEDGVYEATSQKKTFLFSGVIGLKFKINCTVDQHKALKTYNNKSGRMGFYDKGSNVIGTSPDGTIFKGFKLSYIRVSDMSISTDATPAYTTIEVQFANNSELNETLAVIRPYKGTAADNWYPSDLPVLSKVLVEQVGLIAANVVVFNVLVYAPSDTDNAGDQVATGVIEDLDVATFTNTIFTDGAGAVLTPSTITESATIPGQYTATFPAIIAGADVEIAPTTTQVFNSDVTTFA